ncbi:MAG TPA: MFS transporter [Streptosporangiaceae bacterium]|nr:MFS transporter [Streptosporangiaceae bacterium]
MVLFQAASAAPAPLYVVYQRLWGFSAATLTLIFAIFVLGLLAALLVLGTLSDYLGRRTVLAAAIALELAALLLFLRAGGVPMLLAARLAQGIATGMALPALSAALVDFNPPRAPGRAAAASGVVPIGGLAFGALACSALVQYAPAPTRLVWTLLVGAMLAALLVVAALPESGGRRPGIARSLIPRLGVPRRLRGDVWALVPIIVASWALGGLYLSLGPSAVVTQFGLGSHFFGGLEVALLCGTGAATACVLRRRADSAVARISTALLTAGTALTLLGIVTDGLPAAVAGTVLAGIGYGASGLSAFGSLARLAGPADPAERGGLFAVAYTIAYLAFSLPAGVAGYAATRAGLRATVITYAFLVILTGLAAFVIQEARGRRRA